MTAAPEGGEWSAARPGRTLPPEKTRTLPLHGQNALILMLNVMLLQIPFIIKCLSLQAVESKFRLTFTST